MFALAEALHDVTFVEELDLSYEPCLLPRRRVVATRGRVP